MIVPLGSIPQRQPETGSRRGWHNCWRCHHSWLGRESFKGDRGLPKGCPRCRSPLWNTPRLNRAGQGRPPAR